MDKLIGIDSKERIYPESEIIQIKRKIQIALDKERNHLGERHEVAEFCYTRVLVWIDMMQSKKEQ